MNINHIAINNRMSMVADTNEIIAYIAPQPSINKPIAAMINEADILYYFQPFAFFSLIARSIMVTS